MTKAGKEIIEGAEQALAYLKGEKIKGRAHKMRITLTRNYKETIRTRVQRDSEFSAALLKEAIESFLAGDVETGEAVLRDFIKGTIGFEQLSKSCIRSQKVLLEC